jgi:serine protease Do
MNTAIVSQSGGYMGIGFAIPSNILMNIKEQLVENGVVTRGFLGVSLQPIDSDLAEAFGTSTTQGALVVDVVEGSPAEEAGLKQGDIITKMNGMSVKGPGQLRNDVVLLPPGTKVNLTINRNGKTMNLPVTLGTFGANTLVSSTTASKNLGFSVDNLTNQNIQQYKFNQDDKGVVVVTVEANTPADRAGIKPGFLVMAVNHRKITTVTEFNEALQNVKPGERILLLVRQGQVMKFYTLKAQ